MSETNTNLTLLHGNDPTDKANGEGPYTTYRIKWYEYPMTYQVASFPLFLDIEFTSACNLKCPICIQSRKDFVKGFMDYGMFKRIVDEAADKGCYGFKCHTIGRGEPLLHPKATSMIRYGKKKGLIDVRLNTNGLLLSDVKSKELLDSGLDLMVFSVDDYRPEVYEKKRVGASWDKLRRNIYNFLSFRVAGGYKTKIRIQTVRYPGLDLEQFTVFWCTVCDEVSAISLKDMHSRVYGAKAESWACPQLWQRMSVLFDGTLLPCNHDDRVLGALGRFPEDSVENCWNSILMAKMRSFHYQGKSHEIPACDGCFLRTNLMELS